MFKLVNGGAARMYIARIRQAKLIQINEMMVALTDVGATLATSLKDAAPHGSGGGGAPAGDAPGALADSFVSQVEETGYSSGCVTVQTTQPTKLKFVTEGTGIYGPTGAPIVPLVKKALYWKDAAHPVRSVRGQAPNDFVSPLVEEAYAEADMRMAEVAGLVVDALEA